MPTVFIPGTWIRTCQECWHKQIDTQPTYGEEPSEAYKERKCKRCKSAALDYGREARSIEEENEDE